jgi:7,8-dihydropterin-6-yl-methyl-4-(beta-D-ribofuranosyl)aminobenzene 5'-phosphate synthase
MHLRRNAFVVSTLATIVVAIIAVLSHPASTAAQQVGAAQMARAVSMPANVKVTILSTMLSGDANKGIGEWGFSALLEVDGRKLLIDTGARPETVLHNADELKIDLSTVTDVVLTHNHADHVGGLVTLRRAMAKKNSTALSRAHIAPGIFQKRFGPDGVDRNGLLPFREDYIAAGGSFVEHASATELLPGVWFTGPVPRHYPERNWGADLKLETPNGMVEDNIPEDSSVVVDTPKGLIVITGCGHAGVVNISEYARTLVKSAPVYAVVGGLHLYQATDATLDWTGQKLKEFGVAQLLGAHCTGIEAVYRLRAALGLQRPTATVGAVGASFNLASGISPLGLAR